MPVDLQFKRIIAYFVISNMAKSPRGSSSANHETNVRPRHDSRHSPLLRMPRR